MDPKGCFSDDELLLFLSQLFSSFGTKKAFDHSSVKENYSSGDLTRVVLEVKRHLNLNCPLELWKVKGDLVKYLLQRNDLSDAIRIKLQKEASNGKRNAPMQLLVRGNVPMMGTSQFKESRVFVLAVNTIFYTGKPLGAFLSSVAHEMMHIILACTFHPLGHIEAAVDILAMLQGFNDIITFGSIHSEGELGYLPGRQRIILHSAVMDLTR